MKYEEPNMELILLESREVFMTASTVTGTTGDDENGFVGDNGQDDGF